jgi:hypothetical protein
MSINLALSAASAAPGAAFCREAVDECLDLRKEILRPKVFRSHDRSPTLVSKPVNSLAEIT